MRVIIACMLVLIASCAQATWKPEYANQSPEVRQWYATRELTPEAQKIFSFKSCCAHSDVVKTQFRVDNRNGGSEWWWMNNGNWERIPPAIIHWDEHAPDNQPTLFVFENQPTCFFPPGAGG